MNGPRWRLVDLSHEVREGEPTYPGFPTPVITSHLTREASRSAYAAGTEFTLDLITMIGNTGTYLDSPFHRYADGTDLAGLALETLVDLPATVVRHPYESGRAIDAAELDGLEVKGCAVLFHTGWDEFYATDRYGVGAPFLNQAAVEALVDREAALVGIDSVNVDDPVAHGPRPAHSLLLAAGIHVVEHLTGLADVPASGALFTAVPPKVSGFGTFPVRAFAKVPA